MRRTATSAASLIVQQSARGMIGYKTQTPPIIIPSPDGTESPLLPSPTFFGQTQWIERGTASRIALGSKLQNTSSRQQASALLSPIELEDARREEKQVLEMVLNNPEVFVRRIQQKRIDYGDQFPYLQMESTLKLALHDLQVSQKSEELIERGLDILQRNIPYEEFCIFMLAYAAEKTDGNKFHIAHNLEDYFHRRSLLLDREINVLKDRKIVIFFTFQELTIRQLLALCYEQYLFVLGVVPIPTSADFTSMEPLVFTLHDLAHFALMYFRSNDPHFRIFDSVGLQKKFIERIYRNINALEFDQQEWVLAHLFAMKHETKETYKMWTLSITEDHTQIFRRQVAQNEKIVRRLLSEKSFSKDKKQKALDWLSDQFETTRKIHFFDRGMNLGKRSFGYGAMGLGVGMGIGMEHPHDSTPTESQDKSVHLGLHR